MNGQASTESEQTNTTSGQTHTKGGRVTLLVTR